MSQKDRCRRGDHCLVWSVKGDVTRMCCAHCLRVAKTWFASEGDEERARLSQANHDQLCSERSDKYFAAQRRIEALAKKRMQS